MGTNTHGDHKYLAIKKLLEDFPALSFVLIGDSGQHDMEIYRQVAHDFPGRIAAIYIRDAKVAKKAEWVAQQLAKAKEQGIEMLLSEHSADFMKDAKAKGMMDVE